ncbi:hypothetical protein F4780DRAFT_784238 [Xylariomycetidae sp. FL0641]|nr:hypothetical protein F4780DRAFT_784238 [Xylariomycetidae sp. FL0641]
MADTTNALGPGSHPTQFTCNNCGRTYSTKVSLQNHKRQTHPGRHCFWTPCLEVLATEQEMNTHIQAHNERKRIAANAPAGSFHCFWPACDCGGNTQASKEMLTRHLMRQQYSVKVQSREASATTATSAAATPATAANEEEEKEE